MGRGWLVLAATALVPFALHADEARSHFAVTAEVTPRVTVESLTLPGTLAITSADVARGYASVPARFTVRSNDPRGYVLTFAPRTPLADRVQVLGLGGTVAVGAFGAEVSQPRTAPTRDYAIEIRVLLDAGVRPGEYALPVALGAASL